MVKTLRITGVLAAILAGVVLAFPVLLGTRTDEQAEQVLSSPSVVEKFKEAKSDAGKSGRNTISPFVKQAEAFALYLNPPAKSQDGQAPPKYPTAMVGPPMPQTVSAKFTLVGTSYDPSSPELSLAFIDEPGKGLRWVRQSSQIGRLVVEQVKDGLVVINDGTGTYELAVPQISGRVSLIEGEESEPLPASVMGVADSRDVEHDVAQNRVLANGAAVLDNGRLPVVGASPSQPQVSDEEKHALGGLVERLKSLRKGVKSGKTGSSAGPQDHNALMEKLISDFKSSHVSAEEADKLSSLGEELKTGEQEPNKQTPRRVIRRPQFRPLPSRREK